MSVHNHEDHDLENRQIETDNLILPASEISEQIQIACVQFLEVLTPEQRRKAILPFDANDRFRWHYVPVEMFPRQGLPLEEMKVDQKQKAFSLLAASLSEKGYQKVRSIINLENILGEIEQAEGTNKLTRDPERYYFTIFGDPTNREPWGWRIEGHHISLHYTIVDSKLISPVPSFFGANPGEVKNGKHKGLRILSEEEDLARHLLKSLSHDQKSKAVLNVEAPHDILTREQPKVEIERAQGLSMESMSPTQREVLTTLIYEYIERMPHQVAQNELKKLRHSDLNLIHFAWAGGEEQGQPHYYRLHGQTFFVEYDNVQNDANHVHSIWRHLEDDFGVDLLRQHYHNQHH